MSKSKPYYYHKVHKWLKKNFGKANKCEGIYCNGKSKVFHYALKRGKSYDFKRENFVMLCRICHTNYDFTEQWAMNISKGKKGFPSKNKKPVIQLKDNVIINKYNSITEASKETGILLTAIGNCLTLKTKKAGGYQWNYQ